MSVAEFQDIAIEVLGGLCTNISPADLPHGVSPACQDVQFQQGDVRTRPGLTSQYALANNPTVNYMKSYINLQQVPRFLSLDSLGNLRKDPTPGGAPLTVISSTLLPGVFGKSCSAFGREYIALGNGQNGTDLPRQYDDTNLDRVSQVGPGVAPIAIDANVVLTLVASPNGATQPGTVAIVAAPNGCASGLGSFQFVTETPHGLVNGQGVVIAGVGVAVYNGNYQNVFVITPYLFAVPQSTGQQATSGGGTSQSTAATYTTTGVHGLHVGDAPVIVGNGVVAYNVTKAILSVPSTTTFTIDLYPTVALAGSGGGTITTVGHIPAGVHHLSCIFETRNGYFTKPAPPRKWTAGGALGAAVSNIPLGPPNVIARILCFTAAAGASFYHLGPTGLTSGSYNMYIPDNTTTDVLVDFDDAALQLGTLDDPLFRLIELPECAGAIDYAERLFWWGELNLQTGFLNLSIDGGTAGNYPAGWAVDATNGAGGVATAGGVFGLDYIISGNGATAVRGLITQSAYQNYLLNPILQPNTAYTVRVRLKNNGGPPTGTVHINLTSASGAFTTVGISLAFAALTNNYAVYTGNLTSGLAVIPSDLLLQVYVDGAPSVGTSFIIKAIQVYPTAVPLNPSNLRASGTGDANNETPESYDIDTGKIIVSENNGQAIRCCFKHRERLYIVKEHSFFATEDDGVNEPSGWKVDEVSSSVGTPSVNGVGGGYSEDGGEDWVVIAHRSGLYLFWGGQVSKICPEIQPTWDTINWLYGWTLSVTVDTRKRRIFVCAPFGASTVPNQTLVLDYHDVGGPDMIASMEPVRLSYTGKKIVSDKARKWSPWTVSANSIAQIEQANGQSQVYFGSNDGTGNINLLDDSALTDNGAAIPSFYTTAAFPELSSEQPLQLRSHRKLFGYLTLYVQGVGTLGVTAYPDSLSNAIALNPITLSNPAFQDTEMMTNLLIERLFYKFSSSGVGQWFSIQRCCVSLKVDPWAPVRGAS